MKSVFLCILFASACLAQDVADSLTKLGVSDTWVLAFNWTGRGDGAVQSFASGKLQAVQGYSISQIEIAPSNPAPSAGYSVTVNNDRGLDVLAGSGLNITLAKSVYPQAAIPPVNGTLTLSVTGNSQAAAKGAVYVYFTPQLSVNLTAAVLPPFFLTANYSGVQAAINAASAAGGGTVLLPLGITTVTALITVPSNIALVGQGQGITILQLPNGAWPATPNSGVYKFSNGLAMIGTVDGATNVHLLNFTLDMNGVNNSANYLSSGNDIWLQDCTDCSVEHVTVKNSAHQGAMMQSVYGAGTASNNLFVANTLHGYGSANIGGLPTCTGGIFAQGRGDRILSNYADNMCDSAYIANGQVGSPSTQICDVAIENNYYRHGTSLSTLVGGIFTSEACNHSKFVGNTSDGPGNLGAYLMRYIAGFGGITDLTISANTCLNVSTGTCLQLLTDGNTNPIKNATISGNNFSGGIFLGLTGAGTTGISNVVIGGANIIHDCGGTGIFVNNGVNGLLVEGNTITGCTGGAGFNNFSATNTGLTVRNNAVTNNSGLDFADASGAVVFCGNTTDSFWNGLCNKAVGAASGLSLVNGANQNVSTLISGISAIEETFTVVGPTGAFNIGGFANGYAGKVIRLFNGTGQVMTLNNQDGGSTAANRITTPTAGNVTANAAVLIWNPGLGNWSVVSYQ